MAPDYAQAVAWYRKGAEQSHNLAQYNLGRMYHSGTGVEQNDTQALYWFKQAALQGHCASQERLAYMYGNGKDVGKFIPCRPLVQEERATREQLLAISDGLLLLHRKRYQTRLPAGNILVSKSGRPG